MNLPKMVMVAHSFGGFLSTSYSMKYPQHVEHLLLVDPWGFDSIPTPVLDYPLWKLSVAYTVRLMVGCFSMVRAFGPFGELLIKYVRPDLLQKYSSIVDSSIISQYIYHCNNNGNPSGEAAFHRMTTVGPWPRIPIGERMKEGLSDDIPVTIFYGENTWLNKNFGLELKAHRKNSYTDVKIVQNAGHHVYTDNASIFNAAVLEACQVLASQKR